MKILLGFFLFWISINSFQNINSFWEIFISSIFLNLGILVAYYFEKWFFKIYIFTSIFSIIVIIFMVALNLNIIIIKNFFIGIIIFIASSIIISIFKIPHPTPKTFFKKNQKNP
jgi:hypothetical protein